MRAWRLTEHGKVSLDETESQPIGLSCVKIKLQYCSVSVTDRLLAHGKLSADYPLILGRQAVGMVVETGESVKNFVRGDVVAVRPQAACSSCPKCLEGKPGECENPLVFGMTEDGMLRDFAIVSSADIVKLPERVQTKDAVFLDYIDIAIETVSRLNMDKGQYLVIAGATQLGIILAQVAIYYQIIPIVVDIDQSFLELAAQKGVYYTVNSLQSDTKKKIFALTGGRMADAAAYMTESEYPFAQTMDFVKERGSIAVCGIKKSRLELSTPVVMLFNRQLALYGIAESNRNITSAVNMLANKTVDVSGLIAAEIPFEDAGAELVRELNPQLGYLKTLVKI